VISKSAINFNKEIIFGEVGAIAGAQVFGYFSSLFAVSASIISLFATAGAIIGAAIFFISLRIYDKFKEKDLSRKKFTSDLLYFTPVAFVLTIGVYYPVLFFMDRAMLNAQHGEIYATFISQFAAFACFFVLINFYRYFLLKFAGKRL
jgi:uncharacterized membrane protein YeaQ/YmgE (transglycosylase-associated protein family)